MKTAEAKPVTIKSAKSTQPFFRKAAHNSFSKETENGYSSFFKASNSFIQTKLSIGQPNDIYENEADAMADKVVQRLSENEPVNVHKNERAVQTKPVIPAITNFVQAKCSSCEKEEKLQKKEEELSEYAGDSLRKRIFDSHVTSPYHDENTIQRKCAECEKEETIQQKSTDNTGQTATPWLESRLNSSMGNGTPLSGEVRNSMESSFGTDFSRVRIHTGSDAVQMNKDLNAQAFTHGSDIYFNSGKYDYKSTGGKHLLAHELTHVVQQNHMPYSIQQQLNYPIKQVKTNGTTIIQRSRLRDFTDTPTQNFDTSKITDQQIQNTQEYKSFMNPKLKWQWGMHLSTEEALLASRLILRTIRNGASFNWQTEAVRFAMEARGHLTKSIQTPVVIPGSIPASSSTVISTAVAPLAPIKMAKLLVDWSNAGLLSPPYKPLNVPEIPPLSISNDEAVKAGIDTSNISIVGIPAAAGMLAPMPLPTGLPPGMPPPFITPPIVTPPVAPIPPLAPPISVTPVPTASPGPSTGTRIPIISPVLAGVAAAAIIIFYPSDIAPEPLRWTYTNNPFTGDPFKSKDEADWVERLTPSQRDYLDRLNNARRLKPDPTLENERNPYTIPTPEPSEKDKRKRKRCISAGIPRKGGNSRHDAYARKVSGSADDYFVAKPDKTSINYDGLDLKSLSVVWEVKVGHGWFFNPSYRWLRDMRLAAFDSQKNRGLDVAAACGYIHLWTIPDPWVADLLNKRWGYTPFVLSLPE